MNVSELSFDDLIPAPDEKKRQAAPSALELSFDDLVKRKQPASWADVLPSGETMLGLGKSAASAVPKGIYNALGVVGDVRNLRNAGSDWLAGKMGISPEQNAALRNISPFEQWAQLMPTSGLLKQGAEMVTGPQSLYEPQTRAEKGLDTFIQMAVGMGKPSAPSLMKVVLPSTIGTETAGALSGDNPWWRALGGILGGGAAAATNAWLGVAQKAVRDRLGPLSPEEVSAAEALHGAGQQTGVHLTGPEAFGKKSLLNLAGDVAASRTGGSIMETFLDKRPDQVRRAVSELLREIGPQTTPQQTSQVAQKAATDVISNLMKDRTVQTAPLYEAAAKDTVPTNQLNALFGKIRQQQPTVDPDYAKALGKFVDDLSTKKPAVPASSVVDQYGRPVTPAIAASVAPRTEVGPLSSTFIKTREQLGLPSILSSPEDRIVQGILGPHNRQLQTVLESNSQKWADANAAYRKFTEQKIEPTQAGPVGRVAGEGFTPADVEPITRITGVISDAQTARPETIRELYTALNKQDRSAFPAMARTHLENTFDLATKRQLPGENVKLGSKWANDIRGTDQQRANFDEVLRGVADAHGVPADQLVNGTNTLFKVLEATGKIPGVGSPTAGRLASGAELKRNPITAATDIASTKPATAIGRWADEMFYGHRNAQLARWFTDPDSVNILIKMAKLKPDGVTAKYYLGQLLNINREANTTAPQ